MEIAVNTRDNFLQDNFCLTQDDVAHFNRTGFLKLKGFLTTEFIGYLRERTAQQVEPPRDNFGNQFSRFKYDLLNDDERVLELVQNRRFARALDSLFAQEVFFVQGIGFCIDHKTAGFPWHVGTQSFGYQRLEDFGASIWIPLAPIDPTKQGGGMAYVPKDQLSGTFVYQHVNCLPKHVSRLVEGRPLEEGLKNFLEVKHSLLNAPTMDPILRSVAAEDAFELGDALIFDKHVIHRSIPLRPGPIEVRHAFVMRFCGIDARYNKHAVDMLEYPRRQFAFAGSSDFNLKVCTQDNQLVRESSLFEDGLERRIVKVRAAEPGPEERA